MFNRSGTVALKDHRLVREYPGDPYRWLFSTSETRFFLRTEETEIEFHKDPAGKVIELILHNSDGSRTPCPRIDTGK
jgi:hypothetical protein